MSGHILILAERQGEEFDNITYELMHKGKAIAHAWDAQLAVLLLGNNLEASIQNMVDAGTDMVLAVEHASLVDYHAELYAQVIASICQDLKPRMVLMGYTYLGMEMGPALSAMLGCPLVSNCIDLELADETICLTRPMYGGTIQSKVEIDGATPLIASFEKGAFPQIQPVPKPATVKKIAVNMAAYQIRSKILDLLKPATGDVDITKAKILVSVGRGIGNKENIELIQNLADALGGTIACSRPIADMGWLPETYQVGISAKTVAPNVYIACGISGASQHVTAMRDSDLIIAINKDPNAPIFRYAHYGFVGDMFDILPSLIEEAGLS